jgi:hypothetical protein
LTTFKRVWTLLVILLVVAVFLPAGLHADAVLGQPSTRGGFEFTHGPLPDGWNKFDLVSDPGNDPPVEVEFVYFDPDSQLPRVVIHVQRRPQAAAITMGECIDSAYALDLGLRESLEFMGRPDLRITEMTDVEVFNGEVGGFPSRYSEVTMTVIEIESGPSDFDMSPFVPPMNEPGPAEIPDHEEQSPGPPPEQSTEAAPEPERPPVDVETMEMRLLVRFNCVEVPTGVVAIMFAAQSDHVSAGLAFVGTFQFVPLLGEATPTPEVDQRLVKMCEEAFLLAGEAWMARLGYSDRDSPTRLQRSHQDLETQMLQAIRTYSEENPGNQVWMSRQFGGTLAAANWLATPGGTTFTLTEVVGVPYEAHSHAMVLTPPGQVFQGERRAVKGTEESLYHAMNRTQKELGRRLEPGDVYLLALRERDGDARLAALLAHNTLRSLARLSRGLGDSHFTNLARQPDYFSEVLAQVRGNPGDEPWDDRYDNAGPWYHLFGVMYFEMQARGDRGPFASVLLPMLALPTELWEAALTGRPADFGLNQDDPTFASRYANGFEQGYRASQGHVFDPEKYCINIWGARVGATVYLEAIKHERVQVLDPTDEHGTGNAGGTLILDPPPVNPSTSLELPRDINLFLSPTFYEDSGIPPSGSTGSPASVSWESSEGTMLLDQASGGVYGYAPVLLIPVFDVETLTWDAEWYDFHQEPYTLRFEGSETGTLHFSYFVPEIAQVATWVTEISEGEIFQIDMTPGRVDAPMTGDDGARIEPIISDLPQIDLDDLDARDDGVAAPVQPPPVDGVSPNEPGAGSPVPGGTLMIGLAAIVTLAAAAIAVLFMVFTSRRRANLATQAPQPSGDPPPSTPPSLHRTPEAEHVRKKTAPYCHACGRMLGANDRYCGGCGKPVRRSE